MKPQTIGRVLGIGLRVAGRMAGQRLAASSVPASRQANHPVTVPGVGRSGANRTMGRQAARSSGSLTRGVKGLLRPFQRIGGIVFLEVTGVFFLLFVLVFGQMAWRLRLDYAHGPGHPKFLVAAGMTGVFLYLTVSSFWRARRR